VTVSQIFFILFASATLVAAYLVVTVRNLIHAALWLVASLLGIAAIFVMLDASFMATVEVVLYIGAIAILIVFAVMLTRRVMEDVGPQRTNTWWFGAILSVLFFASTSVLIWITEWPTLPEGDVGDTVLILGKSLVDPSKYVVPFEIASVLLIVALIGSIAVALPSKESE